MFIQQQTQEGKISEIFRTSHTDALHSSTTPPENNNSKLKEFSSNVTNQAVFYLISEN